MNLATYFPQGSNRVLRFIWLSSERIFNNLCLFPQLLLLFRNPRWEFKCPKSIYLWMNEWMNEVTKSCPTLCDPMEQPTRLLHPWDFPGQSTGVGCHFLLQGIFPTQRLNRGLLHCRQTLYHLSYHGMYIMFIDRRTTKNTPWQR